MLWSADAAAADDGEEGQALGAYECVMLLGGWCVDHHT